MNRLRLVLYFAAILISASNQAQTSRLDTVSHVIVDSDRFLTPEEALKEAHDLHRSLGSPESLRVWIGNGRLYPFLTMTEPLFVLALPVLAYAGAQVGFVKCMASLSIAGLAIWLLTPHLGYLITIRDGQARLSYPVPLGRIAKVPR
jgi:hypothetical protein